LLKHLRYAIGAGLAVGLAAALLDAAVLGWRSLGWLAFAFLAYGLAASAVTILLALVTGALCAVLHRAPGERTLAALYLGLPSFVLAAAAASETLRRYVVPSLLRGHSEAAPALAASACGFVAGAAFAALLFVASRRDAAGGGPGPSRLLGRGGVAVFVLAVLSGGGLLAGEAAYRARGEAGRNLVIVSIDALRPDHLSCYGYGRPTSPNIDRVSGEGARFDRAICQSPGSTASHASMMTGLYPLTHGAWNVGDSLQEDVPTLQGHLRDRGYATAFFGNNFFLGPRFGFSRDYESYGNEGIVYKLGGAPLSLFWRSLGAARLVRAWRSRPGAPSTFSIEQSLAWIRKNKNRKFFLFLHIMDPHAPYSPPGEYRRRFFSRQYDAELHDGPRLRKRIASLEPWEKDQLVDLYDGEVAYADSKIGALVRTLTDCGIYDRTVLVITADHAEVLAEHGGIFNHGYLWDCCVRVPLIVRFPPAVPAGIVRTRVVQLIDVAPTALSLLGEPPLPAAQGEDLTWLFDESREPSAGADEGVAYTLGGITKGEGYCITERRWKLAWIDDEHVELYDHAGDPGETTNLLASEPEIAARLKKRLLLWVKESSAAALVPKSETLDLERLDEEVKERLRTLGYVK